MQKPTYKAGFAISSSMTPPDFSGKATIFGHRFIAAQYPICTSYTIKDIISEMRVLVTT
jgi:hypothetical protein